MDMKRLFLSLLLLCSICNLFGHNVYIEHLPKLFGLEFGCSYEVAAVSLENRFGEKSVYSTKQRIEYRHITYASVLWDYVILEFQYDKYRSYLNRVIFSLPFTKDVRKVKKDRDYLYNMILNQDITYFDFKSYIDDNGFKYYYGGPHLLFWSEESLYTQDENKKRFITSDMQLFTIDIVKIDDEYAARLIYGPIPFVKDEL